MDRLSFNRLPGIILTITVVGAAWLAVSGGVSHDAISHLTQNATSSPTPAQDPIQIDSIRARKYPGGPVQQIRDLGEQGGYRDTIISYPSDSLIQYARVSTPQGATPAGGWPVIILLHGYVDPATWQTDGPTYGEFMGQLAKAGFVVIRPDYRGHGLSQGTPAGGHFAPDYTYDVINLVRSLPEYQGINARRVGLLGHSLGGHVALRAAVASDKDIKATALLAGVVGSMYDIFYNWPRSPAPNDRPVAIVQGARQKLVERYGEPRTNPTFWDSVSAINYVKYMAGPVQIHHSDADDTVPKLFADHLHEALVAASRPVEYQVYTGNDHQFLANRNLVIQNLIRFYTTNL